MYTSRVRLEVQIVRIRSTDAIAVYGRMLEVGLSRAMPDSDFEHVMSKISL